MNIMSIKYFVHNSGLFVLTDLMHVFFITEIHVKYTYYFDFNY